MAMTIYDIMVVLMAMTPFIGCFNGHDICSEKSLIVMNLTASSVL